MQRSQLISLISSDEDDELPSLAERVKMSLKSRQSMEEIEKIPSESESDEEEFRKFSERIRSTPFSQAKCPSIMISESTCEKPKILKDPDPEKNHAPPVRMKLDFSISSESEDELSALNTDLKQSEMPIQKQQDRVYFLETSESDSDEVFSNLTERFSKIHTPSKANKENYNAAKLSDVGETLMLPKKMSSYATPLTQNKENCFRGNESESDESFSNFVEKLKTPLPIAKKKCYDSKNSESDESFSSFVEKLKTPMPIRKNCSKSKNSESDESFSNFVEQLQTPLSVNRKNYSKSKNSVSDESFSSFIEKLNTPFSVNRKNYSKSKNSESDESFSNFVETLHTPFSVNRKNYSKSKNSESDESFSNFVEKLNTPFSVHRKNYSKSKNSESDESFSNFVEKLHTPFSVNRRNRQQKSIESDSDDSFLNSTSRLNSYRTPMSQNKFNRRESPLVQNLENKLPVDISQNEGTLKSTRRQSENETEFLTLFPPDIVNSSFFRNRETCTRKLFSFFNKKIFDSKLPEDMPLIWTASLTTTAGLTCCSCKNNVYTCSIKLSSKLLSSFDHLQNTLLHEMCHAAVWIINKQHRVRHGPLWQIWASNCKLILPFIECPERCHNYEIQYSVWYCCTTCNWKKGRCKRVKKFEGAVCKKCKNPVIMTYVK